LRIRRGRALWSSAAAVVCVAAIGIAISLRSEDATPSGGKRVSAVRGPGFNVLPASFSTYGDSVVQVDADRAVIFGGVTWDERNLSVSNEGVIIDFAKKTSTVLAGPTVGDGLVRLRGAVSGPKVLFFGMECASGPLPEPFDGEGDLLDPCVDGPLMLTTLDLTTGTWTDPVAAPASVGGNVRWNVSASTVGDTAVIEWYETGSATETFTAYDIPTGAWRALDSPPPGRLRDSCSTRTNVVQVTYDDASAGSPPPSAPLVSLLDPKTGQWTSVEVPHQYGPAVGGLVCTPNHPVVYGTPTPSFATVLFTYSPADAKWQLLPSAPVAVMPGRFMGVGDVLVAWSDPGRPATPSLSFETIDLAQPEPRWSANATGPPATAELATGVHPGGVGIAHLDDKLYRIIVRRTRG
jgi:hypothetical protein